MAGKDGKHFPLINKGRTINPNCILHFEKDIFVKSEIWAEILNSV